MGLVRKLNRRHEACTASWCSCRCRRTSMPLNVVAALHPLTRTWTASARPMWGGSRPGCRASAPCTPLGCILLAKSVHESLEGLEVVVIGRSNVVGKPLAQLLLAQDTTVTIAHRKTRDLPAVCRRADVLFAAVGQAQMVDTRLYQAGRHRDRRGDQPGGRARAGMRALVGATWRSPRWRRWRGRHHAGSGRRRAAHDRVSLGEHGVAAAWLNAERAGAGGVTWALRPGAAARLAPSRASLCLSCSRGEGSMAPS